MDATFFDGHDELYHHAKFGEDRATRAGCRCKNVVFVEAANCRYCFYSQAKNQVFRLDALALSVIATATWLAGWLGGWLGGWLSVTAGIVSKRLNVSENFFDHLIAPS